MTGWLQALVPHGSKLLSPWGAAALLPARAGQSPTKTHASSCCQLRGGEQTPLEQRQLRLGGWQLLPGHLVLQLCVPPALSSAVGARLAEINSYKAPAESISLRTRRLQTS